MKRLFCVYGLGFVLVSFAFSLPVRAVAPCANVTLKVPDPDAACLTFVVAFPPPDVARIDPDTYTLSVYSFWRVGPHVVDLYDEPGGSVVGQIASGFNFVWARLEVDGMSGATGAPDAYALQSIPWIQYFDNDITLHGTYWHDRFGYRRSRGCVNLSISDARYVYWWMGAAEPDTDGEARSYVYVYSSGTFNDRQS
jgi:hypothetical protein